MTDSRTFEIWRPGAASPEMRQHPRGVSDIDRDREPAELAQTDARQALTDLRPRIEEASTRYDATLAAMPKDYRSASAQEVSRAESVRDAAGREERDLLLERGTQRRRVRDLSQRLAELEIELRDRDRADASAARTAGLSTRPLNNATNPVVSPACCGCSGEVMNRRSGCLARACSPTRRAT
jgi:hypothetical protein